MTDTAATPTDSLAMLLPTQAAALASLRLAGEARFAATGSPSVLVLPPQLHAHTPLPEESVVTLALPDDAPAYVHQKPQGRLAALAHWSDGATDQRIEARRQEFVAWRGAAARVLDERRPAVVLTSDDRLTGAPAALLAEAGARGIPRVVVPYALSRAVGSVRTRRDRRPHVLGGRPLRKRKQWIAENLPGQVHAHDGAEYLFFSPEVTLALHAAGMLPERPWAMGGGLSDAIALASEQDRAYVESLGVDRSRLHVVGDLSLDWLHGAMRGRDVLRARHAAAFADPERPLVVAAVPQLCEQGLMSRASGDAAARAFVAPLHTRANVLVSLHPKCDRAHYAFLEREFAAVLAPESLNAVLPAADLFVAGFSSTVRWAVAAGIPTVVADLGWWGYDIYDDWEEVITVRDDAAYRDTVDLVLDAAPDTPRGSRAETHCGPFDGRAAARLLELLDALVATG